ncbi:MAG: hypothetical protein JWP52_2988 [Rhizobacter sp.]|jgi:hypothetical protein|nr:hypothetical protein [Rhizobacter sp.]
MIKRVPVSQLQPGVYLRKFDGRWTDVAFRRESFVLDATDLAILAGVGISHAWIDLTLGIDASPAEPKPAVAPTALIA